MNDIDLDAAEVLSESCVNFILDEDDTMEIRLPMLDGSFNWRLFKEKLIMKLSTTCGLQRIPLDYVIDQTPLVALCARSQYTKNDEIDVYDPDFIKSSTTHYGAHDDKDNQKVPLNLKKHLLITPSCNNIINAVHHFDGRLDFRKLMDYYKGEDYCKRNISSIFEMLNSTFERVATVHI